MHAPTAFLVLAASLTMSNAFALPKLPNILARQLTGPPECSADTSKATATPFSGTTAWNDDMTNCLMQLNTTTYAGTECVPREGPTFGFWKGEKHYGGPGYAQSCFNTCYPCLKKGIDAGQAVTTNCKAEFDLGINSLFTGRAECHMGFDWGT